jgi:hypothetical protein
LVVQLLCVKYFALELLGPGSESETWDQSPLPLPLRYQSRIPLSVSLASASIISQSLSLDLIFGETFIANIEGRHYFIIITHPPSCHLSQKHKETEKTSTNHVSTKLFTRTQWTTPSLNFITHEPCHLFHSVIL